MRPRIVMTWPFLPEEVERLRAAAGPDHELVAAEVRDGMSIDSLVTPGTVAVIAQQRPSGGPHTADVRWHQALSAGVEHLLAGEPWPDGVTLTNGKGVYAIPIGQYVLAAMLRVNEFADARRELQERGVWEEDILPLCGIPLRGQTLVVVGYGSIGRETARVAAAMGMRVIAVTRRPERKADDAFRVPGTGDPDGSIPERTVGPEGLVDAIAEADFISINAPLTPASRRLVDARALAAMRPSAWIINTGRGALIDEAALLEALGAGRIGGAVLDVFSTEPLPADSPFWGLPNVVITPHLAGPETAGILTDLVADNLSRFVAGRPLVNIVDVASGY
jgi:phosphoglycerate dehydrogenase-like enzyme